MNSGNDRVKFPVRFFRLAHQTDWIQGKVDSFHPPNLGNDHVTEKFSEKVDSFSQFSQKITEQNDIIGTKLGGQIATFG